jgi:hypothetical protein
VGQALVISNLGRSFIELLRPQTVLGRLQGTRRTPARPS